MPAKPKPIEVRFWPKVDRRGPEECWHWLAGCMSNGYGAIGIDSYLIETAHRVSWTLAHGQIPSGLWVLHKCDNRKCVNPGHLYLGTVKDNSRDLMERGKPSCWKLRSYLTPTVERRRIDALPRGAAHHRSNARLTETQVRKILIAQGSQQKIAERYGVCQQLVSKIKLRKIWGHLAN